MQPPPITITSAVCIPLISWRFEQRSSNPQSFALRANTGVDGRSELLHQAEVVAVIPDLGDLTVFEAENVDG